MDQSAKINDMASTCLKFTKAEEGLPTSEFQLVESRKSEVGRCSSAFEKISKQVELRMIGQKRGK